MSLCPQTLRLGGTDLCSQLRGASGLGTTRVTFGKGLLASCSQLGCSEELLERFEEGKRNNSELGHLELRRMVLPKAEQCWGYEVKSVEHLKRDSYIVVFFLHLWKHIRNKL